MKTYKDWCFEFEYGFISIEKLRQPGASIRILPPKGTGRHYYDNVVPPKKINCPICDYYKHLKQQ